MREVGTAERINDDGGIRQRPVLLSVNVGKPCDVSWRGKTLYTGVWKHAVDGPAMARRLDIDGDGQGDLNGHGRPKAKC